MMREFVTPAFVLDFEKSREDDLETWLYTRDLGLVRARITAGQKTNSKLTPYLQNFSQVIVRLVDKHQIRLVDILPTKKEELGADKLKQAKLFRLLKSLSHPLQPDAQLWSALSLGELSSLKLLSKLGLDGKKARCFQCSNRSLDYFSSDPEGYFCENCALKLQNKDNLHELF